MAVVQSIFKNETSENITDQVLVALRQINQAIDLHSRHLVKFYGLTGPQLVILKETYKRGQASVSEIAKATSLSQSTVTGILARLEKRGLLVREKCNTDKRMVMVRLTEKCRDFIASAPPALQDQFLFRFNNLQGWEQLMILSSLQRIVTLMNAQSLDAAPILATGPLNDNGNGMADET